MATTFDSVIDLALLSIQDYKLDKLYEPYENDFQNIVDGFLVKAVPEFTNCQTPLTYNLDERTFTQELSPLEISILSDLWVAQWWLFQIQNVTQLQNKMTPTDFKHYSEAENLKQKYEFYDRARERYNQKMVDYAHKTVDWSSWASGNFGI